MRICIYGAGAVGGHLAVLLAAGGHDVSVVARGAHLDAITRFGLVLVSEGARQTVAVRAADRAEAFGAQDVVIVTLKATSLTGLAAAISPLLAAHTAVVFAQNGIPWWYVYGLAADAPAPPDLTWLDPTGELRELQPRALGAVIRAMSEIAEPGVILSRTPGPPALTLAELDDRASPRLMALRQALTASGVESPSPISLRHAVWAKLLANMTNSVMCLLTRRSVQDLRASAVSGALLARLRAEAAAIAGAHGIALGEPPPPRGLSSHKPSILQDYERGRPMEIDALLVAPLSFARRADVETPSLDLMAALAVQQARDAGLYEPRTELPF